MGIRPPQNAVLVEEAHARWKQSRDSQSSVGNLQVLQAGNQIEALQTGQLMQMESMMAAHYRAEALERSRNLAEAARGRARTKSFLEN